MSETTDVSIPTRATLLHRLKDWQDQPSWQEFFDTYWQLIYHVALQAGLRPTEAEDVVQKTMLSVVKHMPTFQYDPGIGTFKQWLLNLTRWRIMDHLRELNKQPPSVPPVGENPDETVTLNRVVDPASLNLDALWDAEWEKNLYATALAKVKRRVEPQTYQVFDFYVNKGWPPEKVAATFGVSLDQVYVTKNRISAMIKDEVKRIEAEIR